MFPPINKSKQPIRQYYVGPGAPEAVEGRQVTEGGGQAAAESNLAADAQPINGQANGEPKDPRELQIVGEKSDKEEQDNDLETDRHEQLTNDDAQSGTKDDDEDKAKTEREHLLYRNKIFELKHQIRSPDDKRQVDAVDGDQEAAPRPPMAQNPQEVKANDNMKCPACRTAFSPG